MKRGSRKEASPGFQMCGVVARVVWNRENGAFFRWEVQPPTGRPARRPPEECAMAKPIRKSAGLHEEGPVALGELIHAQVRIAIETAVHEELARALGAGRY